MKKVIKIFAVVIIPLVIVALIITMIVLPGLTKNYINKHGKELIGRKVSVNDIHINYLKTICIINDFKLFEPDEKTFFFKFDTLLVDLNPWPLFRSELNIEKIRLVKPVIRIVRHDTIFNFDDMIAFQNAKPRVKPEEPSKPLSYVIKEITMSKGELAFTDKGVNYSTTMKDLSFFIPAISFNQDKISKADVKFSLDSGGKFEANFSFDKKKGAFMTDFVVDQFKISPFLPYTTNYFRLKGMEGLLNGKFKIMGCISKPDSVTFSGKGTLADFAAYNSSGVKVIGGEKAKVIIDDTYPMKFAFNFDTIAITKPYLNFEMKDSTNNFIAMLVPDTTTSNEPFNYSYRINHFALENGLIDFHDNTYEEPFNYHFSEIALNVDSVSNTSKWLSAFASARLNQRGKLNMELGINPSDPMELKVNWVMTNFQLTDLTSYSRHFVGFPIILGNMYYKGLTIIKAKQITSENKLIVRNAKLGKKQGGIMNLPLKLALYILKDKNGDVIMDIPVRGDLNDPKVNFGKIVWNVIKNFLIKIVSSPFRAIGNLVGIDPKEVKGLEFNYADTTLTDNHLKRIRLFSDLEKDKPDMKMQLNYLNDNDLEKKDLALKEVGKIFAVQTGLEASKEAVKFNTFLNDKLPGSTLSMEEKCLQIIGNQKIDSIQQVFSNLRIKKIETALKQVNEATKIRIVVPDKQVPENIGSRPVFELKYSVEE